MNYFIILLLIILVIIYLTNFINKEKFTIGYDPNYFDYEPVNYNERKQDCRELTNTPGECVVDTVVPSNKIVCTESLTPITNNEKYCKNNKNNINTKNSKEKNPTLSLKYDYDLLPSFNQSQINGDKNIYPQNNLSELETFEDLKTDIRSFASLENDLMSNY
jgi:hypothetical protein